MSSLLENKLFIGMIPKGTTEEELLTLFTPFGTVVELVIIKKGDTFAKGFGFCRFATRISALNAIRSLSGHTILHVIEFSFTLLVECNSSSCYQVC